MTLTPAATDPGQRSDLILQLAGVKVFLSVAQSESVARAARQMFKAPSAVSRSIIELEKAVGVHLFERSPRGILLNDFGRLVLGRAGRIDAELAQAAAELARLKTQKGPVSASAVNHLLYNGRKLQLIAQLVEFQKISSVAAHLDITQSGASMSLARIEAALGAPLFQRGTQGMIATEAASRLAIRARRVFAELRHMMSEIASASGELKGTVVIGTLPLGRTHVLPMALAMMMNRYPGIRLTTIDSPFEQMMAGLRDGTIDAVVGVAREGTATLGMAVEPLFEDRLTVMAREGHPLTRMPHLGLADLMAAQWVLPWRASPSRALFEAAYRREGLRAPTPVVETADLPVIRQLLTASDAVALASARQMLFELRSGLLVELPVPLTGMSRTVGLITRQGSLLPPSVAAVLDALRMQVEAE